MKPASIALVLVALAWAVPADSADLKKIARSLTKEPKYSSQPCYALLVFGIDASKRAWLVVDGETVYVDRNGNGDLTEADERVPLDVKATKEIKVAPGAYTGFNVFDLRAVHGVRLTLMFWVRNKDFIAESDFDKKTMKERDDNDWENASLMRIAKDGSSAQNPVILCRNPRDAQVSHLDGPLTFCLRLAEWQSIKQAPVESDLSVCIGTPGLPTRNSSYPVFSPLTTSEVPADVHPLAQVVFPHKVPGQPPIKLEVKLDQRC